MRRALVGILIVVTVSFNSCGEVTARCIPETTKDR